MTGCARCCASTTGSIRDVGACTGPSGRPPRPSPGARRDDSLGVVYRPARAPARPRRGVLHHMAVRGRRAPAGTPRRSHRDRRGGAADHRGARRGRRAAGVLQRVPPPRRPPRHERRQRRHAHLQVSRLDLSAGWDAARRAALQSRGAVRQAELRAHARAPRRMGRPGVREPGGAAQAARGLPEGHSRAHRADAPRSPPVRAPDRLRGARQLEGVRGQLSRRVPRPVRPPRAVHAVRLRRLRDRSARLVFGASRSAHRRPQRVHGGGRRSTVLPDFPQPHAERGAGTTAAERGDPDRAGSLQGDVSILLRRRDVARGTAAHRGGHRLLGQGAAGRRRDLRAGAARARIARVRQRSLLRAVRGGRLPLPEAPEDSLPRPAQALMPELKRQPGLLDSTMINVGTIIAAAIFIVPSAIALELHASVPSILVWVAGGGVSLLGALSVAELGAAMPKAGGIYVYLREAYGPVWGYLYGWTSGVVINPASIAAIALGFATYLGFFVPLGDGGIKAVAVASIVALTLLNSLGVRLGAITQNVLTLTKMGLLAVLIVVGFVLPGGNAANLTPLWSDAPLGQQIASFGVALVAVLWAYDGWIEGTYVGGEGKDPERNVPRSIVLSELLGAALYCLVTAAFAYVLSPAKNAGPALLASHAAQVTLGRAGAGLVAAAIMIATIGSNNGIVLTAARVPYAMARDGLLPRWLGGVHPRFLTPVPSLAVPGAISIALTLISTEPSWRDSYNPLFTYVVLAEVGF